MKNSEKFKKNRLLQLLLYVKHNVEFYSDKIPDDASVLEKDFEMIFRGLPIICKKDIMTRQTAFLSKEVAHNPNINEILSFNNCCFADECFYELNDNRYFTEHTSGTSGIPFTVIKSDCERLILGNIIWKIRNDISHVKPNDMYDFTNYKSDFCMSCNLNDSRNEILYYLKDRDYKWWYTNEHSLRKLSNMVKENNIEFNRLQVIENSGAFIFDKQIEEYEETFRCKVTNNYACREIWNIAYSCKCGYLHVNDYVYLEIVDDNGNIITEPDVEGNVVITSLILKTMPFIRYKLGDRACWVSGKCDCDNNNQRIALVPKRELIKGTNLYGNIVFQSIITMLLTQYNLTKYSDINIVQISEKTFVVNIKGNKENTRFFEKAFLSVATSMLKRNDYIFRFTYDDNQTFKSLFSSC